jgi:hypothetical protein
MDTLDHTSPKANLKRQQREGRKGALLTAWPHREGQRSKEIQSVFKVLMSVSATEDREGQEGLKFSWSEPWTHRALSIPERALCCVDGNFGPLS